MMLGTHAGKYRLRRLLRTGGTVEVRLGARVVPTLRAAQIALRRPARCPHGFARFLDDGYRPDRPASAMPALGAMPEASRSPTLRYQLGRKLGAGGMAEVYTATIAGAEGFQRQVAIKRVLAEFSELPAFATMLAQEAQIMSRLDHPNIVGIVAFDRDPDGQLFLAMEYVDGCDLASLAETGRLPIPVTIFIITEVLQGLGYAHDFPDPAREIRGVVHRDVSPHNVLLAWTGAVKVSDFGIAKACAASGACSVRIKGKPHYMSPEQIQADPLDGRSDLFAVGIILWELLTGQPLFAGTSREAMSQVCFRDIPLPSEVRANIPRDVEAVVMKLLERDRTRRYASAEQAIDDLSGCANAPRNGRRELIRMLAQRFPTRAPGHRRDLAAGAPATGPHGHVEPTGGHTTAVAPPPASLHDAPDRSPRRQTDRPQRRVQAGITVGVGIAVLIIFLALWLAARIHSQ